MHQYIAPNLSVKFIPRSCRLSILLQDTASQGYATSDDEEDADKENRAAAAGSDDDIDMEDLGGRALSGKLASTSQAAPVSQDTAAPREMLTPALRANLGKQGYKLIGRRKQLPTWWLMWCCCAYAELGKVHSTLLGLPQVL